MGSLGNTRWGLHWKKATVEESFRFSLTDITRGRGQLLPELVGKPSGIWWTNGSSIGYTIQCINMSLQLFLGYSVNGQKKAYEIELSETSCNYGGVRYWMHCPHCYKRVTKLYIVGGQVACRQCHDLTYSSAQEAHQFDSLKRVLGAGLGILDRHYEVQALIKKMGCPKTPDKRRKAQNRPSAWPAFVHGS